jgi:hypothetical protein
VVFHWREFCALDGTEAIFEATPASERHKARCHSSRPITVRSEGDCLESKDLDCTGAFGRPGVL